MSFTKKQQGSNAQIKYMINKITHAKAPLALALMLPFTASTLAQEISGVVLNTQGQPIDNAAIQIGHDSQKIFTNAKGEFSLTDVKEGTVELHISSKKYSHQNQMVTVTADEVSKVNVVLTKTVMEVVDVYATPLHASSIESALPINVVSADELKMKQAATLGETLKNEVGINTSYYGPVASTPIIRGLDGPRVLITQNGLDVGDASRVGPDHIVAAETTTATQIEVLRGPATLFYGSGAIGGVVNVVDGRVPTSSDDEVDYLLQYNDVAKEKQASVNIQTGTEYIAFHVDGYWRESDDYKLAGPAEVESETDEEDHDESGDYYLDNSASTSNGATFGASYLLDNGFVGLSYGFMNREYGIPGHSHAGHDHDHDHDHAEEGEEEIDVYANMNQDRWQMLGEYNFDQGFITKVAGKLAYSDYQHEEIEAGLTGTIFTNESTEARFDLYHQSYFDWKGAWTIHYKNSDFAAEGEEAFTPPSESSMLALAWLEEKHFGSVLLQLGARLEQVTIEVEDSVVGFEDNQLLAEFGTQDFTPISTSAGLVWDYQEGYNIGLSLSYSQRAPAASELFSFGPHIGTSTFEVGAGFALHQENGEVHIESPEEAATVETSLNFDLTFRKFDGDFGYVLSAFYNRIDDYYYQNNSGLFYHGDHIDTTEHDGALPIYIYQQEDVAMYGGEAEFIYQVTSGFTASIFSDYIRAQLVNTGGNDNLPRIPPLRLGAIFDYQAESFDAELSFTNYFEQDDTAELETSTDSYTMIDAHFNYYIDGFGDDLIVFVKGQNLANVDARVHTSFLKDVAPLPARSFSIGVRGSF
ncbi:TonB-dependent receptor [Colwellia sp. E2M01]|uniref:TonB-dependent receptor n=1 Tax=Colwellia sp. E2M01 TaxID=2841561 RepID=UPI001C09FDAD|nr:TonB-dependent receptor [Colwellia sp. E2M01]MBU2870235.1 TonB-dependent receptor [Colwellia sp. E2M01]